MDNQNGSASRGTSGNGAAGSEPRDWRANLSDSERALFCQLVVAKLQGLEPAFDPKILVEKVAELEGYALRTSATLQDYIDYINSRVYQFEAVKTGSPCANLPYLVVCDDRWDRGVAFTTQGIKNSTQECVDGRAATRAGGPSQEVGNVGPSKFVTPLEEVEMDTPTANIDPRSSLPDAHGVAMPVQDTESGISRASPGKSDEDPPTAGSTEPIFKVPRPRKRNRNHTFPNVVPEKLQNKSQGSTEGSIDSSLTISTRVKTMQTKYKRKVDEIWSCLESSNCPMSLSALKKYIAISRELLHKDVPLPAEEPYSMSRVSNIENFIEKLLKICEGLPIEYLARQSSTSATSSLKSALIATQQLEEMRRTVQLAENNCGSTTGLEGRGFGSSAPHVVGSDINIGTGPGVIVEKPRARSESLEPLGQPTTQVHAPSAEVHEAVSINVQSFSKEGVVRECKAFMRRNPGLETLIEEHGVLVEVSLRVPSIDNAIPALFLYIRVNARTAISCALDIPPTGIACGFAEKYQDFLLGHTTLGGSDGVGSILEDWLHVIAAHPSINDMRTKHA